MKSEIIFHTIPLTTVILRNKIFHNLLKKNKKPTKFLNYMSLNQDVVQVTKGGNNLRTKKKVIFDYFLNLSTLTKGKKINLPFNTNVYIDKNKNEIKHHIQISKTIDNKYKYVIVKEIEDEKEQYQKKLKKYLLKINSKSNEIGVDLGLRVLFTSSNKKYGGSNKESKYPHYYGKDFIDKLTKYDQEILRLFKEKQKHKLSKKQTKKYKKLVKKLQDFIKNEINKGLNKLIKKEIPSKLVFEKLDFRSPRLSKRLNRIIGNFGKKIIKQKLERITEKYGIQVEYINPSYTSQTCSCCGYIDKRNRSTQSKFSCIYCNIIENINNLISKGEIDTVEDFLNKFYLKYKKVKDKNGKNIKRFEGFYFNNKKIKMNLIKSNADYNRSLNILRRSSSQNIYNISLYDKKSIILGKIIEGFITKIPQNHNSLVERLGNNYIKS